MKHHVEQALRVLGPALVLASSLGCGGSEQSISLAAPLDAGTPAPPARAEDFIPPDRLRYPRGTATASADGTLFVVDAGGVGAFATHDAASGGPALFRLDVEAARNAVVQDGKLFVMTVTQVHIYDPVPTSGDAVPRLTLGRFGGGCSAGALRMPTSVHVTPGGQLIVSDFANHRVLIWNAIPTSIPDGGAPADRVVGQPHMNTCGRRSPSARSLSSPSSAWSDGHKLLVVDQGNHRVLGYDFPTEDEPAATLVIGQQEFTEVEPNSGGSIGPAGFAGPNTVAVSPAGRVAVVDFRNNRVLVWNSLPLRNKQPADAVIGQAGFEEGEGNGGGTPGASTLWGPTGVAHHADSWVVVDSFNHRVLLFPEAEGVRPRQ